MLDLAAGDHRIFLYPQLKNHWLRAAGDAAAGAAGGAGLGRRHGATQARRPHAKPAVCRAVRRRHCPGGGSQHGGGQLHAQIRRAGCGSCAADGRRAAFGHGLPARRVRLRSAVLPPGQHAHGGVAGLARNAFAQRRRLAARAA